MLRILITIIELFLCLLLQTSVFSHFVISGVMPDVLLVMVIAVAYFRGQNKAIIIGFFSGLLLNITSGGIIGISSVIYMFIGYMAGYANKLYAKQDFIIPNVLIVGGELFYSVASYLTGFFLQGKLEVELFLFNTILPRTIYTFLVGLVIYPILHIIHRLLLKAEGVEDRDFTNN